MNEWVRTGGTISDEELADRWSEVELESRPAEDVEWDEDVAGMREYETIATLDGEDVARMRYLTHYDPASVPGSGTSRETQAELDELTCSRADATGKPVVVAGFSESGKAMVSDVEFRDGRPELVPVGTVPITASRPPKVVQRPNLRGTPARTPRGVARPRERRNRRASALRASPSGSEADLEPPGVRPAGRRPGMPGLTGFLSVLAHALRLPRAFTRPRRRGRAARRQRRSER
jgi:hypothetical protein